MSFFSLNLALVAFHLCPHQCEIEAMSSSLSSSDTKSLRLSKEVSSLESQLNDAKVTVKNTGQGQNRRDVRGEKCTEPDALFLLS